MGRIRQRRSFRRSWRAFIADAAGLAAIEMALIFPMAAMLMSLIVYGGQAYFVWRKVTTTDRPRSPLPSSARFSNIRA
jgi:Flp pilus assembly protein TadG